MGGRATKVTLRVTKGRRGRRPDVAAPMLPKAERRALGRAAAAKRAAAARRRRLLNRLAVVGVALGVVLAVAAAFGAFSGDTPQAQPSPTSPTFPPLPEGADPALATKPVVAAGEGDLAKLTVTTLIEGTGEPVQSGQTISVNYVGVSYQTGAEFDSSWKNAKVFITPIGQGRVIKGWDQGLVGVKVGSRVQLDIPAELAYGDDPSGGGPTGPLRFVVDVLAIES